MSTAPNISWLTAFGRDEMARAIVRGGLDICPCMRCGEYVVCIPDGLPCCEECAKAEGSAP